MKIVKSKKENSLILTDITQESKAFWGYDLKWLRKWIHDLTITEEYIINNTVYHLQINGKIIAYYSLVNHDDFNILDNLFVYPKYMRKGYGKILLDHAIQLSIASNKTKIKLYSDPNAEMFYIKNGFIKIGQKSTDIENRFLPIMELYLKEE